MNSFITTLELYVSKHTWYFYIEQLFHNVYTQSLLLSYKISLFEIMLCKIAREAYDFVGKECCLSIEINLIRIDLVYNVP